MFRPKKTAPLQVSRDQRLVKKMLGNDERAFKEFVDQYLPRLYRYTAHRLAVAEDIEELVQNVLVKAIRRLETYRGEATLLTWLISICRNEISQHYKKQARTRDLVLPFMDDKVLQAMVESIESPSDKEPEAIQHRGDVISLVQLALDQLPEHYAKALELKYIFGHSSQEIACELKIGDEAVQSLLARARRAFREVCGEAAHILQFNDDSSTLSQEN